jgi:hypothetical protein
MLSLTIAGKRSCAVAIQEQQINIINEPINLIIKENLLLKA